MAGKPGAPSRRSRYDWVALAGMTAPTREELSDLLSELHAAEREAPQLSELFQKQRQLIEWQLLQTPMSRREIDRLRWYFVVMALEGGKPRVDPDGNVIVNPDGKVIVDRMTVDEACEAVAEKVRGTPVQAEPDMISKSYFRTKNDPNEKWRRGHPGIISAR